jgi:hypothetical protein
VRGGEVDQAMGVERVARLCHVEAELQPGAGSGLGHPLVHRERLVARDVELLRQAVGQGLGCGRRGRVELEAPPLDLDIVTAVEQRERLLEPALADVAPRADHVGPDLDLHVTLRSSRARPCRSLRP